MVDRYNQSTDPRSSNGERKGSNRRDVLKVIGGGAIFSLGATQGVGITAADEDKHNTQDAGITAVDGGEHKDDNLSAESLSARETGQLRGEVMSSAAMKAIREDLRAEGIAPDLGEGVVAQRVTNEDTGHEWSVFKTICERVDEETPSAILYAQKRGDEIYVRSIAKSNDDLIIVNDCTCNVQNRGSSDDVNISEYQIPVSGGDD